MMKKLLVLMSLLWLTVIVMAQDKGHLQVLTGAEVDIYSEPYYRDFNIIHAGFGYKGNLTAIYGKINLGSVYKKVDGVLTDKIQYQKQFEIDYYQSLSKSKSTTFWINYAYSQDMLFPKHRVIYEVWQKLPANFLVSGGGRHYIFTEDNATIFDAGLENYFSRYWLGFKTYFFLKEPNITYSYSLTGRVFFKDVNYLELGVGIGSAQDEPFMLPADLTRLDARTAKIRYVTNIFNQRMKIAAGFTYSYEEYKEDMWRNRYSFGVGLIININ